MTKSCQSLLDTNLQNKKLLVTKIVTIMKKKLQLVTNELKTNLKTNSFGSKNLGS